MQAAIHESVKPLAHQLLHSLADRGASYALFGDRLLVYGTETNWPDIVSLADAEGLLLQDSTFPVGNDLYLVIQTGALFQRENPDVRVVLNASRYLAVTLDPERAKQLEGNHEYRIERLEGHRIIFDIKHPPAHPPAPVARIEELVGKLCVQNLQRDLEYLTSFKTRYSTTRYYSQAGSWATGRFEELGYEIYVHPISIERKPSRNIVAGRSLMSDKEGDLILLVAHLDSINQDNRFWLAPGADDNASGSAGLLEIARVMKDYYGRHELRFVLFGGEEDGL